MILSRISTQPSSLPLLPRRPNLSLQPPPSAKHPQHGPQHGRPYRPEQRAHPAPLEQIEKRREEPQLARRPVHIHLHLKRQFSFLFCLREQRQRGAEPRGEPVLVEAVFRVRARVRDAARVLDCGERALRAEGLSFGLAVCHAGRWGSTHLRIEDRVVVSIAALHCRGVRREGRIERDEDRPVCGLGDVLEGVHPIWGDVSTDRRERNEGAGIHVLLGGQSRESDEEEWLRTERPGRRSPVACHGRRASRR